MMTSDNDFMQRLLATFSQEAEEHLQQVSSALMALEQKTGAAGEQLELAYRGAHSLKGAARAVNLTDVEELCQAAESVLSSWRKGSGEPSAADFDLLHTVLELARALIGDPECPAAMRVPSLVASLQAAAARPATGAVRPPPASPEGRTTGAPPAESSPPPAASPARAPSPDGQAASSAPATSSLVRVTTERLDSLFRRVEATLEARLSAEELSLRLADLARDLGELGETIPGHASVGRPHGPKAPGAADPGLDEEELAAMSQRQGEHRRLRREANSLLRISRHHQRLLGHLLDGLSEETRGIAMQPVARLLDGFPAMVRAIARQEEKEALLVTRGSEVEIDKRVLDAIKDPLTHLLRNCVDHGLERPAERRRVGKPAQGQITVAVQPLGGDRVELTVSDDGAGIDPARIRAAARRSSARTEAELAQLSDREALELIFESGVTSAPLVTDLSGRGLGLAIVRQKAEELGGSVCCESAIGRGTTFRLRLPLSVATFRGLVVEVTDRTFVVPVTAVIRVLRLKQEDVSRVEGRESFLLDGRLLPFVRMEQVLGLARRDLPGVRQPYVHLLVLRSGDNYIGFAVDRVVREQEVLVKGLGPQLVRVGGIAGATVMGDGRVVPVLNAPDLLERAGRSSVPAGEEQARAAGEGAGRILVAEDSITSRMLLKNILEAAGYEVTTAVDGAEAFALLRTGDFDLLVSDVEMPRMNGFQLTAAVRADSRLAELPVVLVTALSSREDREKGVDSGANAYIVKSSFEQSNLLAVVERFL